MSRAGYVIFLLRTRHLSLTGSVWSQVSEQGSSGWLFSLQLQCPSQDRVSCLLSLLRIYHVKVLLGIGLQGYKWFSS